MRWNTRSAPERSTRTAMPGYVASNDFAIFSATERSIDVYQTILPSFLAASISAGVTASAAGAAEATRVESAAPARAEPDFRNLRLVILMLCTIRAADVDYPLPLWERVASEASRVRGCLSSARNPS